MTNPYDLCICELDEENPPIHPWTCHNEIESNNSNNNKKKHGMQGKTIKVTNAMEKRRMKNKVADETLKELKEQKKNFSSEWSHQLLGSV